MMSDFPTTAVAPPQCAFAVDLDPGTRTVRVNVNDSPQIAGWCIDPGDGSDEQVGVRGESFIHAYDTAIMCPVLLTVAVESVTGEAARTSVPITWDVVSPDVDVLVDDEPTIRVTPPPPSCRIVAWSTHDLTLSVLVDVDIVAGEAIPELVLEWDELDDAEMPTITRGMTALQWVHHTYRTSGAREIVLTARDAYGQQTTARQRIAACDPPVLSVTPGLPTFFTPNGQIWWSDDGTPAQGYPAMLWDCVFPQEVPYGKTMHVIATENRLGGRLASPQLIQRFERPTHPTCTVDRVEIADGAVTVHLTASGDGASLHNLTMMWGDAQDDVLDFATDIQWTMPSLTHTYATPGVYHARCRVTTILGQVAESAPVTMAVTDSLDACAAAWPGSTPSFLPTWEVALPAMRPYLVERNYECLLTVGTRLDDPTTLIIQRHSVIDGTVNHTIQVPFTLDEDTHVARWEDRLFFTAHTEVRVLSLFTGEVFPAFGNGMCVDVVGITEHDGLLYLADRGVNAVHVYTLTGEWVDSWSCASPDDVAPGSPHGITVADGIVVISDVDLLCLKGFSLAGDYQFRIDAPFAEDCRPTRLTHSAGQIYCLCVDEARDRVLMLSPDGQHLATYQPATICDMVSLCAWERQLSVLERVTSRVISTVELAPFCDHQTVHLAVDPAPPVTGWRFDPGDGHGWQPGEVGHPARYRAAAHRAGDTALVVELSMGAETPVTLTLPVSLENHPPMATLTVNPTDAGAVLAHPVFADADGTVVDATLDWGDGTSTPVLSGAWLAHTYPMAGTYILTLTVRDDNGAVTVVTATSAGEE